MKVCLFSLFFAITFWTTPVFSQHSQNSNRGYIVKVGDTAPDFIMQMISGDSLRLSKLQGKVVVLQFTASWCSVCRKEMPHLEKEVWQRFKDKDFVLIGVDYDEPLAKVIAFRNQMKVTYPFSLDPNADIFSRFANKKAGVTRNVVIDKNGIIIYLTRLYNTEEFEGMVKKIEELLQ
jgi:peroxiredoxin